MMCFMHTDPRSGREKVWCINQISYDRFEVFFGKYPGQMQHREISATNANHEVSDRVYKKTRKGYYPVKGFVDAEKNFHLTAQTYQRDKPSPNETETVAQPAVKIDLSKLHNGQSSYF